MRYEPRTIEKKWRAYWTKNQVYKVENPKDNTTSKPKFYVLDMFPYPSGSGLHVGHPLGYIASDIMSRFKRHQGFNVLHPMGFDAFGLPAEQYAVEAGVHPEVSTYANIDRYREQLDNIGLGFDWSREVRTSDPRYYKWTQWIFIRLFSHYYDNTAGKAKPVSELVKIFEKEGNKNVDAAHTQDSTFTAEAWMAMSPKEKDTVLMNYRLAYRKVNYVNWCEALGTVLANDEVKDGLSERGGHPVEQKPMLQWSLRITAYAERLLNSLDKLEWSDSLKAQQRNWIGRSDGAKMFFPIAGSGKKLEIFTTRPDTIFGTTFMVLAPEHEWVEELTTPENKKVVDEYITYVKTRSERERLAEVKQVTGAFTGAYAINPVTGKEIPIWISEYVLKDYGTGAIMAVPSDDDRDYAFAKKFGLEIIEIIDKSKYPGADRHDKLGIMINSGFLTGMEVPDAIEAVLRKIEEENIGERKINYKLRDANFGRQRYWGEPFPIVYDHDGVAHALDVSELPLVLPKMKDFKSGANGKSPLSKLSGWVNLPDGYTRETDTMPGFAGSSWYYFRYMDPHNDKAFASKEALEYWQNVDFYVGGTEHAVGHLMYARFWNKFLYDLGLVPQDEPFKKLVNQGMIQGVMELIYMQREKVNGVHRFVCAGIAAKEKDTGFITIPVHVDFVKDYGTDHSHLDVEGIKQFIAWRPEYKDAIFEVSTGVFQKGVFTPKDNEKDCKLLTKSEVTKMSKSKYNVVNPDQVIEKYGADCFRMYEMFLGPIEDSKPWDTKGIDGVSKFLRRFWHLYFDENGVPAITDDEPDAEEMKILHTTIKKVTENIERFSLNTCVSEFMICTNQLKKLGTNKRAVLEPLAILINPFAPHIAEELWHLFGHKTSVNDAPYPVFDEQYLQEDTVTYPIMVNGKKRALADFPAGASKEELEKLAIGLDSISKWLTGKTIRKVIVVPGKIINLIVG